MSAAIAVYATVMIVTLAFAFSNTVKQANDSEGAGITFGRVFGLLLLYPTYRVALVFVPLSMMFFYLYQASPNTFFTVPVGRNNPISFMHLTAEALALELFRKLPWSTSGIVVADGQPWSWFVKIALLGAPVAAVIEVMRAWALAIAVIVMKVMRKPKRVEAPQTAPSSYSSYKPPMNDSLGAVSSHEQRGARL